MSLMKRENMIMVFLAVTLFLAVALVGNGITGSTTFADDLKESSSVSSSRDTVIEKYSIDMFRKSMAFQIIFGLLVFISGGFAVYIYNLHHHMPMRKKMKKQTKRRKK